MDPLVDAETLASYLQRDLDTASADLALRGASGIVRSWCGWRISLGNDDWAVNGTGSRHLMLPTLQLQSVNDVLSITDGDTVTELIPGVDFTYSRDGVLYRAAGWPVGLGNIDVLVTHGFDPVPDEAQIVVCAIAARLYSNPESLAGKSSGDGGKTYTRMSTLELGLLSRYRLS